VIKASRWKHNSGRATIHSLSSGFRSQRKQLCSPCLYQSATERCFRNHLSPFKTHCSGTSLPNRQNPAIAYSAQFYMWPLLLTNYRNKCPQGRSGGHFKTVIPLTSRHNVWLDGPNSPKVLATYRSYLLTWSAQRSSNGTQN
jgi:hypothetical protein